MEPFRDDNDLAATLSALRPTPRPAFAAELDERAAAGFPRRGASLAPPVERLMARLRALPPRRLVLSGGVTALAAVLAATAIVAVNEPGPGTSSPRYLSELHHSGTTAAPATPKSAARGDGVGGQEGTQYEAEVPSSVAPGSSSAGSGTSAVPGLESAPQTSGPYASGSPHRDIEQSAEMVLGADPADVGDDAAKVFDAVHASSGIVLSSSIEDGPAGDAGAEFELLIPSAKLGDALAAFSGIDEVLSRHQATADITAPTVNLSERLQDSRAKVEGLLEQLANADTDAERAAAEAQLRAERRHAAALRSQLSALQRRANLSRVSLRIESGGASSSSRGGDNGWGVGDALDDAGHILGIAAGVAIVGLAILAPLALIALLIWLASAARLRRRRERALD
jgi:hypothetical protein